MELILLVLLVVYFLPSIVGSSKKNIAAIVVLNLFLGWTVVGWVVAFMMAVWNED